MTFGSFSPDSAITSARGFDGVDTAGDGGNDVLRVRVGEGVDGVEAQPVDVEVAHPLLGRLEDPLAHGVGCRVVEVHRHAPRRPVLPGEVRPEGLHRLDSRRAEVVIDDVQDDGEPLGVGGVDQALEPSGPP